MKLHDKIDDDFLSIPTGSVSLDLGFRSRRLSKRKID